MAITNAQQYKQLVNPPMKGKKRPGYRGDDAARSDRAARSEGRASMGRADPGNAPQGDLSACLHMKSQRKFRKPSFSIERDAAELMKKEYPLLFGLDFWEHGGLLLPHHNGACHSSTRKEVVNPLCPFGLSFLRSCLGAFYGNE